jgi:hypothetical protein
MKHYDLLTAFLQSDLDEKVPVFMEVPKGFPIDLIPQELRGSDVVWRLKKAVYGLPQAAEALERRVVDWMIEEGFSRSILDQSLFIKVVENNGKKEEIFVGKFVDDFFPIGDIESPMFKEFEEKFFKKFKARDNGIAKFALE